MASIQVPFESKLPNSPLTPPPGSPQIKYAPLLRRFLAFVLDIVAILLLLSLGIILGGVFLLVFRLVFPDLSLIEDSIKTAEASFLLTFLILYSWIFTSLFQSTLGKRIFHLRVMRPDGSSVGPIRTFIREIIGKIVLASIFPFIGYILIFFDKQQQGLHDKIADTIVVEDKSWRLNRPSRKNFLAVSVGFLIIFFAFNLFYMLNYTTYGSVLLRRWRKIDSRFYSVEIPSNWNDFDGGLCKNIMGPRGSGGTINLCGPETIDPNDPDRPLKRAETGKKIITREDISVDGYPAIKIQDHAGNVTILVKNVPTRLNISQGIGSWIISYGSSSPKSVVEHILETIKFHPEG